MTKNKNSISSKSDKDSSEKAAESKSEGKSVEGKTEVKESESSKTPQPALKTGPSAKKEGALKEKAVSSLTSLFSRFKKTVKKEGKASGKAKSPETPKKEDVVTKPPAISAEKKKKEEDKPVTAEKAASSKTVAVKEQKPSQEPVTEKPKTADSQKAPETSKAKPKEPSLKESKPSKEAVTNKIEAAEEKPSASKQAEAKKEAVAEKPVVTEKAAEEPKEPSHKKPTAPEKAVAKKAEPARPQIKLSGLFAFKMEMTSFYEEGKALPVTALHYEPWRVSQIKTKEKEGYMAVQLACFPQKNGRSPKPLVNHLKPAGFKEGARYVKELRVEKISEDIQSGHELSIESLKKGDVVKLFSYSKGRGFAGVVKRWGFRGGKASHGAKTHRQPGSIGQCTEPSRVLAGRKMPGHYGFRRVCLKNVKVVDVLPEENLIFVKGAVPGARNTLVTLKKQDSINA